MQTLTSSNSWLIGREHGPKTLNTMEKKITDNTTQRVAKDVPSQRSLTWIKYKTNGKVVKGKHIGRLRTTTKR